MTKTVYIPVFTGSVFGNNEIVLPFDNYVFNSEAELVKANKDTPFTDFFPFAGVSFKILKVNKGFNSVTATIAGTDLLCISGEWFNSVV